MGLLGSSDLTVVIPARNAELTVVETISSIIADHESPPTVIVVDDRSTDATAAVAVAAGATVLASLRPGPGAARNTGVAQVETELLAFCDADDWWTPHRLTEHLEALGDPELDLVLGRTQYHVVGAAGTDLLVGHHFDSDDQTAVLPSFGAATMRCAAFHRAGPIDESLSNYEDYEWFYRARDMGLTMTTADGIAQCRRVTGFTTSRLNPPSPGDLLRVMQRSIRRRRSLGLSRDAAPISDLGRLNGNGH